MNILITNDDGYKAKGLHVLAEALARLEDVSIYVVAPDRQRSCTGHALTMGKPLQIEEIKEHDFGEKVEKVFVCDGFPADCVRLGFFVLKQQGIHVDLVCSGINHGSNWGTDIYYSGTLAAAREASILLTQGIAFSICSHDAEHLEHFYDFVPEVVRKSYGKVSPSIIINVNVPDLPREEIKGMMVCKQGAMVYSPDYLEDKDENGNPIYMLVPDMIGDCGNNRLWDSVVGMNNYVTIVPCDLFPHSVNNFNWVESLGIKF